MDATDSMERIAESTVCDGYYVAVWTCLMTSVSDTPCAIIERAVILPSYWRDLAREPRGSDFLDGAPMVSLAPDTIPEESRGV